MKLFCVLLGKSIPFSIMGWWLFSSNELVLEKGCVVYVINVFKIVDVISPFSGIVEMKVSLLAGTFLSSSLYSDVASISMHSDKESFIRVPGNVTS